MVDLLSGGESLSFDVIKLAERASVAHEVGERRDLCSSATVDSKLSEPMGEKTEVGE